MLFAIALAVVVPASPPPLRISVPARARIIRGTRINLRNPALNPAEAIIRRGLIEFP
ncbi:MAG: hypothetical protein AABY88_01035 [Pseudomonadota bacterium]